MPPKETATETTVRKATSYIQLLIAVAAIAGFIGKIWWDVEVRKDTDTAHQKQIAELERGFNGLKEKAESDKEKIDEKFGKISETVAVVKVIINNIEGQNLRLIEKQDKIYDMLYDRIKVKP
jgi:hypothetical protein